jgi:holo-[acyl-carrier protein] synthase
MLEKIGIGIDIVDTTRFKLKPFDSNKHFYKKIFHDSEIKYCLERLDSSQSFATKFAIKEAVIKSINNQIDFLDILTDHLDSKPTVTLLKDNSYHFLVSVSHEKLYAIAVVISEKCL